MLTINSLTGKFIIQPGVAVEDVSQFSYYNGEQPILPAQFCDNSGVIQLPDGTTVAMNFKQPGGGALLATASPTLSGSGATSVYTFSPELNTTEINAALDGKVCIAAILEIALQIPGQDPVYAVKHGKLTARLFTGSETTPNPGERIVFTSPGGKQFRFQFNDDETFDVIRIL